MLSEVKRKTEGETHRVPQRHLPLAHTAEACAEDLPVRHEHGSDGSGALVRLLLLLLESEEVLTSCLTLCYLLGPVWTHRHSSGEGNARGKFQNI